MMNRFYAEISGKKQFIADKHVLFNINVGAIAIDRIPTRWSEPKIGSFRH